MVVCLSLWGTEFHSEDFCVWKQPTMCFSHSYPSWSCTDGWKELCNRSCLSFFPTRGTGKFLYNATGISLAIFYRNKRDYSLAGCLNAYSSCQQTQSFTRALHLTLKQKSIDTANLLCDCEDINLNIVSKMTGTVWQTFPNLQNKVHFNKGGEQYYWYRFTVLCSFLLAKLYITMRSLKWLCQS